MAYDYFQDTASKSKKAGWGALSSLWSGVLGFADWIGLGTAIRNIIDNNMPEEVQASKIQAKLTARVNDLINQGEIDLTQLEDKLANLKNAGFALTGVALKNLQKDTRDTATQIAKQKVKNAKQKIELTKAQTDIDSIKGFAEANDLRDIVNIKDKAEHIEKEINKIAKGD